MRDMIRQASGALTHLIIVITHESAAAVRIRPGVGSSPTSILGVFNTIKPQSFPEMARNGDTKTAGLRAPYTASFVPCDIAKLSEAALHWQEQSAFDRREINAGLRAPPATRPRVPRVCGTTLP